MNKIKLLPSLLIFAEVANRGSFTEAARHLHMSKSAVSQQLSKLEAVIGAQLLSRNTRGIAITSIGEKLLRRCELLQDQVDLAFVELSEIEAAPSGTLSVTFPHSLEGDIAIPAIRQLCQEYPGLEPRILVTDEKLDLVRDKIDVAIFGGEPRDSSYRALPIGTMTEIWCATPNYIQQYGKPETPQELADHRWIATHWQHSPMAVYDTEDSAVMHKITMRDYAKANTLPSAIEMARQDMGLILLCDIVSLPLIHNNTLVQVLEGYHGPKWPFYFIHPFQSEKPSYITRFYQLISHYFAKAQVSPQALIKQA